MEHSKGFTLTELLITMAIVAILAAVAYPSYQDQARKTRRSDGQVALLQAAQALERCFTEFNAYNAACAIENSVAFDSAEGYYVVTPTLTATTFTLSAAPKTSDPKCTSLTLNQAGAKSATGTAAPDSCW